MDPGELAMPPERKGEHVSLATLTTLKVGGEATVINCTSEEEIRAALAYTRDRGHPLFILGAGSNVLVPDAGFPGIVLRPQIPGIAFSEQADGFVEITVGAGVAWDELARVCTLRGLWGLENLSGIPGLVGGAVVQNIGAYGAALSQTCIRVETIDAISGVSHTFTRDECSFGYRDSLFKHTDGRYIITRATFRLSATPAPNLSYRDPNRAYTDITRMLADNPNPSVTDIRTAVLSIRASKFPDLSKEGTAGSFFENPILPEASARALQARYPEMPLFPMPETTDLKVPLGWILDHVLHLKGFTQGHVRLFENQALVLVTGDGATAGEVEMFANDIAQKVFDATGIKVTREVITLR